MIFEQGVDQRTCTYLLFDVSLPNAERTRYPCFHPTILIGMHRHLHREKKNLSDAHVQDLTRENTKQVGL